MKDFLKTIFGKHKGTILEFLIIFGKSIVTDIFEEMSKKNKREVTPIVVPQKNKHGKLIELK